MMDNAGKSVGHGSQIFVSLLLSPEGNAWIAQCLEWDIAGQGESPRKALQAFEQVFWACVMRDVELDRPILATKEQAPTEMWDQFQTGMALHETYPLRPPAKIRVPLPRVEAKDIRLASAA
jgi:hypothetical protein